MSAADDEAQSWPQIAVWYGRLLPRWAACWQYRLRA